MPLPKPTPRSSYVPCQMALLRALSHPAVVTAAVDARGVGLVYSQRRWHVTVAARARHWAGEGAPLLDEEVRGPGFTIHTRAKMGGHDAWQVYSVARHLQAAGNLLCLRLPQGYSFDLLAIHPLFPQRLFLVEITEVAHQNRIVRKWARLCDTMIHQAIVPPYQVQVTPAYRPPNQGAILLSDETMVHIAVGAVRYEGVSIGEWLARAQGADFGDWVAGLTLKEEAKCR